MFAVSTTRRCATNSLRWTRFASSASSSNGPASLTPARKAERPTTLKTRGRKSPVTRQQKTGSTSVVVSQKNWKSLGLKYDPETLPIKQTLDPNLAPYTEEDYAMTLIHGRSAHKPFFHPRTHHIPVASIHFRSHHVKLLDLFTHFVTHAACALKIPCSQPAMLPTQRRLWTVLRSPFAHKKSQENFERKVHKRAIKAWDADPEVVHRWMAYLREHAIPGVGMRVVTWDRVPVGVGSRLRSEETVTSAKRIEALGKKIVETEAAAAGLGAATVD